MTKTEIEKNVKEGSVLVDDCNLVYIVIEKFKNCIAVQSIGGNMPKDVSLELITYTCIENENWRIAS